MSKYTTPAERIAELVREHGSQRKAAKALGLSQTYFNMIARGEKEPGPAFLDAAGLLKVTTTEYRRTT
jgi:transcriptional regulator with XRE-family HTH domain